MRYLFTLAVALLLAQPFLTPPVHAAETTRKKARKADSDDRSLAAVEKSRDGRKRVALVIGNSAYRYTDSMPKLANPANDADDMAAALRRFGFEVVARKNLTKEEMDEAITDFGRKIANSDASLFYYAGHGLQVKGQNYMVPVDANIDSEAKVPYRTVNVNQLLEEMDSSKSRVNIVILDACRNNPISGKFRTGGTRGLAPPSTMPKGTVVVYATDPGNVAADGSGRNGQFTAGLLTAFKGNDLTLGGVLYAASRQVQEATGHQQTPYINGPATVQRDFSFISPSEMTDLKPQTLSQPLPAAEPAKQAPRASDSLDDMLSRAKTIEKEKRERLELIKADLAKYEEIIASPMGSELKAAAWKALVNSYPEAAGATQYDTRAFLSALGLVLDNGTFITVEQKRKKDEEERQARLAREKEEARQKEKHLAGEFVTVPAGCFNANSSQVCLDSFRIGTYEVTQGQYRRIMGSNPSHFSSCGDDCPVEEVSWDDAQSFISRLNSQTGGRYRLPTETEWEYACRSGGRNEEYCGGNEVGAVAWYDGNSGSKTHPVGQKQPNGLGIYDMSGNVWEWVQDRYDKNYPSSSRNPTGASLGSNRVNRGGSWLSDTEYARAANRRYNSPGLRNAGVGFRLASPVQ
ncbi:MAG: SUMF1/EgtB/PvdO family nonheme iron enzyme [Desulfuromonadales bacterium]